ncbi:MAG: PilZ domain-containing protein [Lachnospiraceae bacterium]|nr:PilZ domain-containing protein [Lachnospiraceae bacterium]
MKIDALVADTEVTVEVITQGKNINLKTAVVESAPDTKLYNAAGQRLQIDAPHCLVKLITVKNTALKFDSGQYTVKVYASYESSYYLWNIVRIEIVTLANGERYHAIYSAQEGVRINRRGSYRLYVGKRMPVQFGEGRPREVLVKDVSVNGVGLVVPEDMQCQIGMKIRFTFKDTYYALSIPIEGTVVRIMPMEEKGQLIGCQLPGVSAGLEKYIYNTQRAKLQGQRQSTKPLTKKE